MAEVSVAKRVAAHPVTGEEKYQIRQEKDGSWAWDDGWGEGGPLSHADPARGSRGLEPLRKAVRAAGLPVALMEGAGCDSQIHRIAVVSQGNTGFLGTIVKEGRKIPLGGGAARFEDASFSPHETVAAVRRLLRALPRDRRPSAAR